MKTRAAKRSLKEEMDMATLNGFGEAAQLRWAINSDKRMREAAAKTLQDAMFSEVPQAPVIDSAQVGRTPPIEPDPCSITHHDHLPASSLLPHRAQDESVAGVLPLALPAPLPVVAVSDDDGPSSESEPEHDLNSSPRSPRPIAPIAPIAVVELPPSAFLIRKVAEQVAKIDCLEERVEALDSQIKTKDEKISSMVSRDVLLCAQKQTLQAKIARVEREVKKAWEQVNALEESDQGLRRMIQFKNNELMQHTLHLRKIAEEHTDTLAVFARRTSLAENRSAALEAAWPAGVPMP